MMRAMSASSDGATENARPGNGGLEQDGQIRKESHTGSAKWSTGKLADKVLANSEQNYGVWKMTDQVLANSEGNYGVWKTQDWKVAEAERINYPHPSL